MTLTQQAPALAALDPGMLSCDGCGRPVPAGAGNALTVTVVPTRWATPRGPVVAAARLGRCPSCAALHVAARAIAGRDDPAEVAALVRALACFRVLGQPLPGRIDPAELRRWFGRFDVTWAGRVWDGTAPAGTGPAEPWGHLTGREHATVRDQHARWLHTRAHPGAPVRVTPPPVGPRGCLACGVAALDVAADHAHEPMADRWEPVSVDPAALGGTGGARVTGWLCPPCEAAATDADGARLLGPSTLEASLAAWWAASGLHGPAGRLRAGLLGGVTGWAVTGRPPSPSRWAHMTAPDDEGEATGGDQ